MTSFDAACELELQGVPFVVVTLVSGRGHVPQDPGAKAIVTEKGLHHGTVGGGKVEARAIAEAKAKLERARSGPVPPELLTWNLQSDIGMTCGGEVSYLFEVHQSTRWKIVVFGAGHVAQAVVRALEPIDCQVTCIDPRPEWVEKLPRSAKLKAFAHPEPARLVEDLDPASFFVVMTQGHSVDLPIYEALLRRFPEPRYIGGIGSDIKALKTRRELLERGLSEETIRQIRCPIGLKIGTNHPAEIAVSVVAELLQIRDSQQAKVKNDE